MGVGVEHNEREPVDHVVQFYDCEAELGDAVGDYLVRGLQRGETVVVVATEVHRRDFAARIRAAGIDTAVATVEGRLVLLDAAEMLSRFMVDNRPDLRRFSEVIGGLVRAAVAAGRPVRAFGEMVALLWHDGYVNAAIELEDLWNRLGRELRFSLYCAYPAGAADAEMLSALEQVCRCHSAVLETPVALGDASRSGTRCASEAFTASAQGVRSARHFALATLERWGRDDLADEAALVITELATNAVIHSHSAFSATLAVAGGALRIAVADSGREVPEVKQASETDVSGRGVQIVENLSSRWGVDLAADGKVVWAEFVP